MVDAIGQSLPIAVGVLISPLPIVAVVLMLLSAKAKANALAFVVAWFIAVGTVVLAVAFLTGGGSNDTSAPPASNGWLKVALGALCLAAAGRQWRGRPRGDAEAETPKWMTAIDAFTPVKAAGLAVLLGAVNPKNLLLTVAGGAAIASVASGEVGATVGATAVFALVATTGVAAPVAIYFIAGERAASILDDLKRRMVTNNAAIMAVILLVIGAKLLGDGISAV